MSWSKSAVQKGGVAPKWDAPHVTQAQEAHAIRQAKGEAPPACPVEELKKNKEQAIQLGYHHGRERGHSEGYLAGHQEGIENGYVEGQALAQAEAERALAEGREAIAREKEEIIGSLKQSLEELVDGMHDAMRAWKQEAAHAHALFGLEVARRAIGQELRLSRESVLEIARLAMSELHQGTEFRVLVNPADIPFLEEHRSDITEVLTHVRGLDIVADRSIVGGCIVESQGGTIDARIEAYLQRLAEHALREDAA